MSCMISMLAGGEPRREIFPLPLAQVKKLQADGLAAMLSMLGVAQLKDLPLKAEQYVGAALRTDGTAFYLTTLAPPDVGRAKNPEGRWRGAFFAPFGIGNIVGVVDGDLRRSAPTSMKVMARLFADPGDDQPETAQRPAPLVSVDWEVLGNQATRPNKASLIGGITIHQPGPHDPADIRRCIALHAPQRCFGEVAAVVAMQCGVAAACLLEAIC